MLRLRKPPEEQTKYDFSLFHMTMLITRQTANVTVTLCFGELEFSLKF